LWNKKYFHQYTGKQLEAAYNEMLVMLNSKSVPAAETVGASVQVMQLYPGQSKSRYI
jgi:hypothetical protein